MPEQILDKFHPIVRHWFSAAFGEPSPPQSGGWESIARGEHTLIVAPTGSGKTLAAFLWCINHLVTENLSFGVPPPADHSPRRKHQHRVKNPAGGVRVVYISPLKALNNDIHRNLEIPLQGILDEAKKQNAELIPIRSAVRTGDTTQSERASMIRNPPDILITTPESLYLMISSEKSRSMFAAVQFVIVDEIHSLSSNKRGVHLSLTLERLEELVKRSRSAGNTTFVRIGLSATQKPLEEVARFLGGSNCINGTFDPRPVVIADAGYKKNSDIQVICPAPDFSDLPLDSVWHLIYPYLLHLISSHTTTLVFVNSRRVAERLSGKLNEIINGEMDSSNNYAVPVYDASQFRREKTGTDETDDKKLKIFAYHGSMSRTVREKLEHDLKAGILRCLITTSALELGIDIGSVDLVVQIQSPKGIARGLQRIGRSGHLVHANSKGRIVVTHRDDLIESTVVAGAMLQHDIERTFIPKNCLDVLAQQIVSIVAVEDWQADDLFDLVRRSYNYHTLPEKNFHSVLDMLAGRYTNEAFRELRARIMWDKLHNTLSALPGSAKLAVMNAGTIPDRGYFGVYLEDRKTKVGEVDEEFIYESRAGDTFILGSNVWRMTDIDANRVIVSPAPGQPARMPFWKGESIGRTYELGVKIGKFLESVSALDLSGRDTTENQNFWKDFPIDRHSVRNISSYIDDQKASTQTVPTHAALLVEGFRDEIGDPRIVVHSPYGRGVNGLLGIVLHHELQQRLGIEIQMLYNDNGILFRCSDVERLPLDLFSSLSVTTAQQILIENIPSSPLFGALFRQNAERAMLLPKGLPGKRRPFFLQRMKAADLLQIVKQYGDFPIVIETMRECLNDVLDLEHFTEILSRIESGEIEVRSVKTEVPSPFASSLLFDFAAVYMYEWDDPKSAATQQAASLNRELLSGIVRLDEVQSVVRNDAVEKVEEQLQFTSVTRKARSPEELMEVFLRLGELTEEELLPRTADEAFIDELRSKDIISPILVGHRKYLVLTEELPLYLPICTVSDSVRSTVPEIYSSPSLTTAESLRFAIIRMLRTHGPLTVSQIAERYAANPDECEKILQEAATAENLIFGKLTAGCGDIQWCFRPNLERIHRASISILRKEIQPATIYDFTQLLIQWQHRHPSTNVPPDGGLHTVIEKLQGYSLPSELWESEIFSRRVRFYDPSFLRRVVSSGEIVCVGTQTGKLQWIMKGDGNYFLPADHPALEELTKQSREIYAILESNGASFLSDIRESTSYSLATLNRSLAELFWRGIITNDVIDEILHLKRYRAGEDNFPAERIEIVNPRRNPLKSIAMRRVREAMKEVPGWNGRWSLVRTRRILGAAVSDGERAARQAEQLLLRYGIVAREIAKREENLLPWPVIALELQRMEMRGEIRRGYFVRGLSGMQFALPEAVSMIESIKSSRNTAELPVVLNACDPANPYGTGIDRTSGNTDSDLSGSRPRMSRIASNYIIFQSGVPVLWLENFGTRIFLLTEADRTTVKTCIEQFIEQMKKNHSHRNEIIVEYCDTVRPAESPLAEILREAGFYRDRVQTMRMDLR